MRFKNTLKPIKLPFAKRANCLPPKLLDPELVTEVLRVMQQLAEEHRTMVVVTHEMGFAREVSNHLIFLHQGRIEEQSPPREVLAQPKSERLAQFLSGSLK